MPVPTPQKKQNRYYFDRNYLLQYINQKVKTKVFVDGRFLDIADSSDLEDELHGVGYDNSGNPKFFDYRSVEQVKAGSNLITLDQLQQQKTQPDQPSTEEEPTEEPEGEEPTEEEPDDSGSEEPPKGEEEPPADEEPGEEEPPAKGPLKAHYDPYTIGSRILQESRKMQIHRAKNKVINRMVIIKERPYYNVTGIITEDVGDSYEIRTLSNMVGRVIIHKDNVKFI